MVCSISTMPRHRSTCIGTPTLRPTSRCRGGASSTETKSVAMTAEVQAILSNPAADAPLEMKKPSEGGAAQPQVPDPDPSAALVVAAPAPSTSPTLTPEEESARREKDGKEEKPRSLAAVKVALCVFLHWRFRHIYIYKSNTDTVLTASSVFLSDYEGHGALGEDPKPPEGQRPRGVSCTEDRRPRRQKDFQGSRCWLRRLREEG